MKKQVQIQYVIDKLSYFSHYIKINNKNSFTDINIVAEGFVMNLLNIILSLDLQNLNGIQNNYPGVDLGDFDQKIAFQVTSRNDASKIEETYKKIFINYKNIGSVAEIFSKHIYFLIIGEKRKFYKPTLVKIKNVSRNRFDKKDIWDINDLIREVVALYDKNYNRFKGAYNLISQTIDSLPPIETDKIIIEEILSCFNRPAFTVAFKDECNLGDFDIAIKNTISLINTGKSADGIILKYNVNDINDRSIKKRISEIILGLNYLRKVFGEMKERGYAIKCKCGDPQCKVIFRNDSDFCCLMNDLRMAILLFIANLAKSTSCDFNVFTEYMKIERCSEEKEGLLKCMKKIYEDYSNRLHRRRMY